MKKAEYPDTAGALRGILFVSRGYPHKLNRYTVPARGVSAEGKRETGANPVRSRHCERGVRRAECHLRKPGRQRGA